MASTTPARKRPSRSRPKHTIGPGGPWSKLAPTAVTRAYDSPTDADGWEAWQDHLRSRKLSSLERIAASDGSPLAWGLPTEGCYEPALALVDWLGELIPRPRKPTAPWEKEASRWLSAAEAAPLTPELAVECLAWCWALPTLADYLSESLWWRLLNHLATLPEEAEQSAADASLLARQLALGELPLAMAYLFGELASAQPLAELGRRTLTAGLCAVADGRKVPHARHLADLRPLLACWTRSRALDNRMDRGWSGAQVDRQLSLVLQAALRLSRGDGRPVFAAPGAPSWEADFMTVATRLAGAEAAKVARLTTVGRPHGRFDKRLPPTSIESEWATLAQLRTNWIPDSPALVVKYDGPQIELELNASSRTLWSGPWGLEMTRGGRRLAQVGPWEQTCWLSDHEIDYLELSTDLEHGVEVERHIVMLRADRVLLLADTILGGSGPPLEYRSVLPLSGGTRFHGEKETREGTLAVAGKSAARVLPLALPEWRVERAPGELCSKGDALELSHVTHACRLFAPLLVDLNPERLRRQLTWRRLTVAEERQNVAPDVAAGFRAEIGGSQWVVYRSLAPPTVRSLLSKSLLNQFLFGVFSAKGKVEPLVEIESA
ncbi:MAG: hypothetical protein WD845_12195 [Pirellulales bacterium]